MHFDLFLGIDYSGAQTPEARLPGLQVFQAAHALPERVARFVPIPTSLSPAQPARFFLS